MTIKHLTIPDAAEPQGPYSQAVIADGPLLFVAAQGPFGADGTVVEGGFAAQARQTFDNIRRILEGAGSGLDRVVRVSVYLADMANAPEMNRLYEATFPAPRPVRTFLPIGFAQFDIVVDVIATVDPTP
ncbi:MAG: RidA family protein [Nitriliruptoraceae bacterium]